MSEWFHSRTFAVLLLLSWLPLIAYLFPLPSETYAIETGKKVTRLMEASDIVGSKFHLMRKQVEEIYKFYSSPAELHNWLLLRWGSFAMVMLMGIIASLLALMHHHFWKIAAITAAACYLLTITLYSGVYLPSRLDARGWLMMMAQLDDNWLLLYRELLFPIMQCVLAMILFFISDQQPGIQQFDQSKLKPHY